MAEKSSVREPCEFSRLPSSDETEPFLGDNEQGQPRNHFRRQSLHIKTLYATISFLLATVCLLVYVACRNYVRDPTLALWSPANSAVKYETVTFEKHFAFRSAYLGPPTPEKDALWESLYDFGISGLSKSEAANLINETLPAPNDPDTYIVQLEVFHLLHCVNLLRKAIYPDEYPDGWTRFENGTVNHNTIMGMHWDHCIDALRQTVMCNVDVTPITFVHNHEGDYDIFPNLGHTHTCRNFDAVRDWAKGRMVDGWGESEKDI